MDHRLGTDQPGSDAENEYPEIPTAGDGATISQELIPMGKGFPNDLSKPSQARPTPNLKNVPQFLNKLYTMVNDPSTDPLIRWSDSGESFLVLGQEAFTNQVLPYFFKHSNFSSFVRQLNMYGFHKVPHIQQGVLKSETPVEILEFSNPNFLRDQPDLLCLATRKRGGPQDGNNLDFATLMNEIQAIRKHQMALSNDLRRIQLDNEALWREEIASRERHRQQQQTVDKIVRFLAGMYGKGKGRDALNGNSNKRQKLMLESESDRFSPVQHDYSMPGEAEISELLQNGPDNLDTDNIESRFTLPNRQFLNSDPVYNNEGQADPNNYAMQHQPQHQAASPQQIQHYARNNQNMADFESRLAEGDQNIQNLAELLGVDVADLDNVDPNKRFEPIDTNNLNDVFNLGGLDEYGQTGSTPFNEFSNFVDMKPDTGSGAAPEETYEPHEEMEMSAARGGPPTSSNPSSRNSVDLDGSDDRNQGQTNSQSKRKLNP